MTICLITAAVILVGAGCGKEIQPPPESSSSLIQSPQDALVPATIYTLEQVAEHAALDDCWIALDGTVYDITEFAPGYAGGQEAITRWCGQDASEGFSTKNFSSQPHAAASKLKLDPYFIGSLAN
ncbi:cytochrome b5 domain-containing protein [Patescibacteria group bacterium]|nr:cytochrome b5 domain-containing protein [Patescibacteria group bacterium]